MSNDLLSAEFHTTPQMEIEIRSESGIKTYRQEDRDITDFIYSKIEDDYPEALKALSEIYKGSIMNGRYFKYLCVHRFLRCNCGNDDHVADIDAVGRFRFERVDCPTRGRECKLDGILCNPQYRTELSDRELEVMQMLYDGYSIEEAAEKLFIAETTIKKHKSNVFNRKGFKSLAEFNIYARQNNIFNR